MQTLQRMQYRTSLVKIVAAVTCALLVLAACGQSQNTGQTSDASQTPSTSSGEDAAAIVVVQAAPFDTLDPGYAESGDDLRLVYHLFEGLVKYSLDGIEVEPGPSALVGLFRRRAGVDLLPAGRRDVPRRDAR